MKAKIFRTMLLILIIAGIAYASSKVVIIFKKERVMPNLEVGIEAKDISCKVISFKNNKSEILLKREDTFENIKVQILDSTQILDSKDNKKVLAKDNIELGATLRIEIKEVDSNVVAEKIYI